MPAPALIVFDLDGTLIDTFPDLVDTLNLTFAAHGVPPVEPSAARRMIGHGVKPLLERGLASHGLTRTPAEIDALYQDYVIAYAARVAKLSAPFAGLQAALDALEAQGHRFAVCTNKLEWLSVKLLADLGLRQRFPVIAGADTYGMRKPDPRHLWLTIEASGFSRDNAIMVGDSRTDIDTAKAAGVPVVGVSFGYTDVPVKDLGPDHVIDHFDLLPDTIRHMLQGQSVG